MRDCVVCNNMIEVIMNNVNPTVATNHILIARSTTYKYNISLGPDPSSESVSVTLMSACIACVDNLD